MDLEAIRSIGRQFREYHEKHEWNKSFPIFYLTEKNFCALFIECQEIAEAGRNIKTLEAISSKFNQKEKEELEAFKWWAEISTTIIECIELSLKSLAILLTFLKHMSEQEQESFYNSDFFKNTFLPQYDEAEKSVSEQRHKVFDHLKKFKDRWALSGLKYHLEKEVRAKQKSNLGARSPKPKKHPPYFVAFADAVNTKFPALKKNEIWKKARIEFKRSNPFDVPGEGFKVYIEGGLVILGYKKEDDGDEEWVKEATIKKATFLDKYLK